MSIPRRLEWDTPAPADLFNHIENPAPEGEPMRTIKLPALHALDWLGRWDGPDGAEPQAQVVHQTARTVTLELADADLRDLISDATYYAEEMGPSNTGDTDYRPAARRCLAAIEKLGIRYTIRHFSVTLLDDEA